MRQSADEATCTSKPAPLMSPAHESSWLPAPKRAKPQPSPCQPPTVQFGLSPVPFFLSPFSPCRSTEAHSPSHCPPYSNESSTESHHNPEFRTEQVPPPYDWQTQEAAPRNAATMPPSLPHLEPHTAPLEKSRARESLALIEPPIHAEQNPPKPAESPH